MGSNVPDESRIIRLSPGADNAPELQRSKKAVEVYAFHIDLMFHRQHL